MQESAHERNLYFKIYFSSIIIVVLIVAFKFLYTTFGCSDVFLGRLQNSPSVAWLVRKRARIDKREGLRAEQI